MHICDYFEILASVDTNKIFNMDTLLGFHFKMLTWVPKICGNQIIYVHRILFL